MDVTLKLEFNITYSDFRQEKKEVEWEPYWFKNAKIGDIIDVQLLHGVHLHWPALDVDLDVRSIENPASYPLVAR